MRNAIRAAIAAACFLVPVIAGAADKPAAPPASPPPDETFNPKFSAEDVQVLEQLLGAACKASPGLGLDACRAAIVLGDKVKAAKGAK
jgi:hypothetical protein